MAIDLDSARQAVMADAGDNIQSAFFPTADSAEFTTNAILYQRKDTVALSGVYTIFVYSPY